MASQDWRAKFVERGKFVRTLHLMPSLLDDPRKSLCYLKNCGRFHKRKPMPRDENKNDQAPLPEDEASRQRLFALIYEDLRSHAGRLLREHETSSLNTSGLVHDAFLRLMRAPQVGVTQLHFFRTAALAMRQIIVDRARARQVRSRHAELLSALQKDSADDAHTRFSDALILDQALDRLASESPGLAQIVELHFFAGLKLQEIAELMEVSLTTIERQWRVARAQMQIYIVGDASA